MLPVSERPETTEGYEGFYHLVSFHGNVTETKMKYFIRDFDTDGFHARASKMQEIAGIFTGRQRKTSMFTGKPAWWVSSSG